MLYPLRFTPIYKTAIWGGRTFESFLGRELPEGEHIAESWDVSGHAQGLSVVENGPLAGQSIDFLMENHRAALLGRHAAEFDRFPLLVKFLDANKQLSVQVHPNNAYVREKHLFDAGKAEAWVVLKVVPGSRLTLGFQRPITKEIVADALGREALEELLYTLEPKVGECYFLPPGTVHSLGAGILLYEIQQCSNLTLRLYDWNRVDVNGQRRELHVEHALETLNPQHWNSEPISPRPDAAPGCEDLIASEFFCLDRWTLDGSTLCRAEIGGDDRCRIVTVLDGSLNLPGSGDLTLNRGETVVLPACLPTSVLNCGTSGAVFLDAYLP